MSIATPMDVITPATARRQKLAQSLQAQYAQNKGGAKQALGINRAALHAMPLFAGAGARDSMTLPTAPMPQLSVPFMQSPGVMKGLGVVNPAQPDSPNVSQAPGQNAPIYSQGGVPQGTTPGLPTDMGVTQSADPSQTPQAGQGMYADGSQAQGPITDPNQLLATFGALAGVRRLYGDQPIARGLFGPNTNLFN